MITRRLVLERNGHKVRTAHTATEALEAVRQDGIDCVLARHDPPVVDGRRAVATIRRFHPQLPIVLLTTVPTQDAYSLADECLSNLDGPEALIGAVANVLRKNGHGRLEENLQESMRLRQQFKELEKKTIEVIRRIRGRQ
jgi:CheY-like chemotaxis protein